MRAPAHILCPSRSSFVLSVPPPADGDGDAPRDNAAHAAAASGPDPAPSSPTIASDLSAMVAAGPAELLAALQRRAADLAGGGKLSAPKPNAGDADAAASALPASTEAGAEAGEDKALGAAHEAKHSAWVKVAGEVRCAARTCRRKRMCCASEVTAWSGSGVPAPRPALAFAIGSLRVSWRCASRSGATTWLARRVRRAMHPRRLLSTHDAERADVCRGRRCHDGPAARRTWKKAVEARCGWCRVALLCVQVRRAHEARFPHRPLPMSDAKLAEVLRGAAASAMHAVLGEQRDSRASFCLDGTVTYTRLRTDHPRTDPFAGLYLGAFGSVGAQALQLQRFTWEARAAALVESVRAMVEALA